MAKSQFMLIGTCARCGRTAAIETTGGEYGNFAAERAGWKCLRTVGHICDECVAGLERLKEDARIAEAEYLAGKGK